MLNDWHNRNLLLEPTKHSGFDNPDRIKQLRATLDELARQFEAQQTPAAEAD
jgi:hypothetical protein